jgi:hypothetical protein
MLVNSTGHRYEIYHCSIPFYSNIPNNRVHKSESIPENDPVKNKTIIGQWTLQSYRLDVYDATTGVAKSNQDYNVPRINTLTFLSNGSYRFDSAPGGNYGVNSAGTVITFKDAARKTSTADVTTLNSKELVFSQS